MPYDNIYIFIFILIVNTDCSGSRPTILTISEGIISSQSSDTRGCGSTNSPWIVSAKPGQTINISIVDFNTEVDQSNLVSCPLVYGFILERSLGINHTICGGRQRELAIYTAKTNQVEIQVLPRTVRGDRSFLLKYKGNYDAHVQLVASVTVILEIYHTVKYTEYSHMRCNVNGLYYRIITILNIVICDATLMGSTIVLSPVFN